MGNWGFKLTQGDTFLDVLDTFKTYYHLGDTAKEIEKAILEEYNEVTDNDSDMQDLIFGIAYGHWHIHTLTESHFSQMDNIVTKDVGMQVWLEQGTKIYNKRKQALLDFIEKLKTPRKNPLKRKKIKQYYCPFEIGDVLTIQLEKNLYGAILVLTKNGDEPEKRVKFGMQNMVFSSKKFVSKPTVEEVLNSKILYDSKTNGYFIRNIFVCSLTKEILKTIEKIGNIKIEIDILSNFNKKNGFNIEDIEDLLDIIQRTNTSEKFKIKDVLSSPNVWNEMLIDRYDSIEREIKIK